MRARVRVRVRMRVRVRVRARVRISGRLPERAASSYIFASDTPSFAAACSRV